MRRSVDAWREELARAAPKQGEPIVASFSRFALFMVDLADELIGELERLRRIR